MKLQHSLMLTVLVALAGCMPTYTLVRSGSTPVAKNAFVVEPSTSWNKVPAVGALPQEERWTQNGSMLDQVVFVGALPAGKALAVQKKKDARQVPAFRPDMSPQDLVSMVESLYRVRGVSTFEVVSVAPTKFLTQSAVRFDFAYVASDQLPRRGRCVLEIVDARLYVMAYDAASTHYYDAALPEFDRMVASAALRK